MQIKDYVGVSIVSTFFKWLGMFSIIWILSALSAVLLLEEDSMFQSIVMIVGTIPIIIIGFVCIVLMAVCTHKWKTSKKEQASVHICKKIDLYHLTRLDTFNTCNDCKILFREYLPKSCPRCESSDILISKGDVETYVLAYDFEMTRVSLGMIGIGAISVLMCMIGEGLLATGLLIMIFGTMLSAWSLALYIISRRGGDGRKVEHARASFVNYHGFLYTEMRVYK